MKKRLLAMLLTVAMTVSMLPGTLVFAANESESKAAPAAEAEEESLGLNVAPDAEVTASYTNSYGGATSTVNNGEFATSDAYTAWNTWGGGDDYPKTIALTWDSARELNGMRVIWWADNATLAADNNVTFPKSCKVQYLNENGEWVAITGMTNELDQETDEVGVAVDTSSNNGINGNNKYWNYVAFPNTITTTSLQLVIDRNGSGSNGVGISEWEVFGIPKIDAGENIALKATASAAYTNATGNVSTAVINDGKLATADFATTWNSWGNDAADAYPTWVELDWGDSTYKISGLQVMWWACNDGGVVFPSTAVLQYWNDRAEKWVDATDLIDETGMAVDSVGVKYGTADAPADNWVDYANGANQYWNGIILKEAVKTNKLRMLIDRESDAAVTGVGIGEWQVYGTEVLENTGIAAGENIALAAKASANSANTPVGSVNDGSLATANASTSWNTWNSSETYPLSMTMTWDEPYEMTSARVMWWSDYADINGSAGVAFPKSAIIEYYDHAAEEWVQIKGMTDETSATTDNLGVKYGTAEAAGNTPGSFLNGNNRYWNGVLFAEPIKTTQLRLTIDRHGSGAQGIGIGELEVYGEKMSGDWGELIAAQITGNDTIPKGESGTYTAQSLPLGVEDLTYAWSVAEESKDIIEIVGDAAAETVEVKSNANGIAILKLTVSHEEKGQVVSRDTEFEIKIDGITSIDDYVTATAVGRAPILPKMVVANGLTFDDATPSLKGNNGFDFAETFNSSLVAVEWEAVDPVLYAAGTEGTEFTVNGTVTFNGEEFPAKAVITVNDEVVNPVANSTVTFENVQLTDEFWAPKQRVNAINSLNKGIYQIEQASGGEPNFINAIKKLNGEPYDDFQGFVFQDSDIYKSIEAISYTLSLIHEDTDPEIVKQREYLEEKLATWISMIEQVQYADGYINTHFTLRSPTTIGGSAQGTHRWRAFANHEMYNLGHFYESAVAYTRYREGIGDPDYSLYVVAKRSADQIVALFGPDGTRHEVPGHEEIELAMVKLAKLVEEYEGEGTGQKYLDTVQLLIDRRGEDSSLRESGYWAGEYSQDNVPIKEATEAVGHAVRACYFYAGVTDIATLLPEGDTDREAYLKAMDTIWDSVALTKTYITGGIGVASHGEDFGNPYELPNNNSYCETCAAIALANWNQRMNLVHEDAKYADVVERTLYNAILVGTNLEGNKFFYSSRLEVSNGNGRSDWFACACCPPNLMRTIAKLSEYMYTVHADDVFVNMYINSEGTVNVEGTSVGLTQETYYPWDGAVALTVSPAAAKEFTLKIRIPGWVEDQYDKDVVIEVNGEAVTDEAEKGYVSVTRTWKKGDVVKIVIPMEIRRTEADPNVTTNAGRIALERGPIVYCMEKAGNAQINNDNNFNPLNFVIPRDAELQATYNEELLNGVVEITGTVLYNNGGTIEEAELQAVPYYAWNNRGDNGVQGQNSSTKMLIWTVADGEIPEELYDPEADVPTVPEDSFIPKPQLPYTDVAEDAWYYEAVEYNYYAGTMTGVGPETFNPDGNIVRGQFASIIHRLAGEEKVEFTPEFPDVLENDWYAAPVLWAKANQVVSGYSDGTFGPGNNIVREQIAIMLHNYATYKGYDTTATAELSGFGDAGQVDDYAVPAMQWAVGAGIINGTKEGNLAPLATATRAECAAMIMNFMKAFAE